MFPWGNESVKKTKSSHSISTVFYSHPESFWLTNEHEHRIL
jgi:hypothetical protein